MSRKSICIVGLPDSGKTTFLAALGCFLSNGTYRGWKVMETEAVKYLQKIGERWLQCVEMVHTSTDTREEIKFSLCNKNTGDICELKLPDRAGEYFKRSFRTETKEREFQEELRNSCKILMFINPDKYKKEPLIGSLRQNMIKFLGSVPDASEEKRKKENEDSNDTDNNKNKEKDENNKPQAGTGVIQMGDCAENVELVQSILGAYGTREKIEITLVVSAWDVFAHQKKPENVVKNEVPLLWQFFQGNKERLEVDYMGISAQGGKWDNDDNREKIKKIPWRDRFRAVDSEGNNIEDILEIMM